MNQTVYNQLVEKFKAHYGVEPSIVTYAPGRIEVLGNHTDYNEGYVFSAAINHGTYFALAPSDEATNRIVAGDLMHEVSFPLTGMKPVTTDTWANYVIGTISGMTALKPLPTAIKAMFLGDIPQGMGLSSSAALEMCTAKALAAFLNVNPDVVTLAKIGQAAEHDFAGCSCGLLDQLSSLCGVENKLVKTDFRTFQVDTVDISPDVCFLMCNTNAKHALVDGQYNSRRQACETATKYFAEVLDHPVKALRDVSMAEWQQHKAGLDPIVANRAAHPIGEDERVIAGAKALAEGDIAGFGKLLFESHESSRTLFENSCPELDTAVAAARTIPGILGARLSGGGFGGCAVVLVNVRDVETVSAALKTAFTKTYGKPCGIEIIKPSQGATRVK